MALEKRAVGWLLLNPVAVLPLTLHNPTWSVFIFKARCHVIPEPKNIPFRLRKPRCVGVHFIFIFIHAWVGNVSCWSLEKIG